jgi:hypothetical protein
MVLDVRLGHPVGNSRSEPRLLYSRAAAPVFLTGSSCIEHRLMGRPQAGCPVLLSAGVGPAAGG